MNNVSFKNSKRIESSKFIGYEQFKLEMHSQFRSTYKQYPINKKYTVRNMQAIPLRILVFNFNPCNAILLILFFLKGKKEKDEVRQIEIV